MSSDTNKSGQIRPFAPPKPVEKKRALTAEEWIDAGLWFIQDGIDAVAVEPIARKLGVTKGSFYWHFADRNALITASLERWEELATEKVIFDLNQVPDPRKRLRLLLSTSILSEDLHLAVEMAIAAAAGDPRVSPILGRVSRRRLEFVVDLYRQMGFDTETAQSHGILAYSAYLGVLHVLRNTPDALPTHAAKVAYVQHVVETLVGSHEVGTTETQLVQSDEVGRTEAQLVGPDEAEPSAPL